MCFRPIESSENGQANKETIFKYAQIGPRLTGTYSGGTIVDGHLVGTVDDEGRIDMRYHHANVRGDLFTGTCQSEPILDSKGGLKLHETWQWTSGATGSGTSVLEQTKAPKAGGEFWNRVSDVVETGFGFALGIILISTVLILLFKKTIYLRFGAYIVNASEAEIISTVLDFAMIIFCVTLIFFIFALIGLGTLKLFRRI